MLFAFDKGPSMRSFDVDGRLHVLNCRISKANVCPYFGREIPGSEQLGLEPDRIYQMYRDPAELERGASTFNNLQLMLTHIPVNADDPQLELTAGAIGNARYEHPYLVVDAIAVWSAEAIAMIESRAAAQLSSSYRYTAIMGAGVTPEGVAYDGRMCNIIGNHVALVEEGRAGPDVVVNDSLHIEQVFTMKFAKLLNAVKSHLKSEADMAAADAAITAVLADNTKPKATAFLRIAAALKPFVKAGALDFSPLAADAGIEAEMKAAEDADKEDEDKKAKDAAEKEEEEKKAKDAEIAAIAKKKADDEAAGVKPGPNEGEIGAALDAAIKAGKFVRAEDVKALTDAAALDAVARVNSLHAARSHVEPLVGVVVMDSAEAVYRFALGKHGVKTDGMSLDALRELATLKIANGTSKAPVSAVANDSALAVYAIPGLSRVALA